MASKSDTVTLQVPVSKETHKRLTRIAAMEGVDRTLVYGRALTWCALNKEFKAALREYCSKKGLGW